METLWALLQIQDIAEDHDCWIHYPALNPELEKCVQRVTPIIESPARKIALRPNVQKLHREFAHGHHTRKKNTRGLCEERLRDRRRARLAAGAEMSKKLAA